MRTNSLPALALAAALLLGGCLSLAGPGTPTPDEPPPSTISPPESTPTATPTSRPTPTTVTPAPASTPTTATSTSTPKATPAPIDSLPSPSECLADAAPRPDPVDGVEPSTYPEPPADVTRGSLVNWTQAFEIAYFRNGMLADESGNDEYNLTRASAYAEVRAVNHTASGYVIRLSDSGATNYASGLHGDRWMDVGYVVDETRVVRVPLADRDDPVRASDGTVVVGCR